MGPMAGVGDSLIQGVIIPLFVAIGISLGLTGNLLGVITSYSIHYTKLYDMRGKCFV